METVLKNNIGSDWLYDILLILLFFVILCVCMYFIMQHNDGFTCNTANICVLPEHTVDSTDLKFVESSSGW